MIQKAIELELKLLEWVNAQPNATEIKEWVLSERKRRVELQDEEGVYSPRALKVEHDAMNALFYMARLARPDHSMTFEGGLHYKLFHPHENTTYSAAFMSFVVCLKRGM